MRFDLELDIVDTITKTGLEKASLLFYNDGIIPFKWDTKVLPLINNNIGINIDKYESFKNITNEIFSSGVIDGISLLEHISTSKISTPVFNGGTYYSNKEESSWSINTIVKYFNIIGDTYAFNLDEDYDISSIRVYTLQLSYPGNISIKREFKYVEFKNSLQNTFNSSNESFKFTILDNIVYLNINRIIYNNDHIGKGTNGNNIFALSEFPIYNLTINNFIDTQYKITSGAIIFNNLDNKIKENEDVIASYTITPIIEFKQKNRSLERPDIVFKNTNITPRALSFKNGSLCFYKSINNESFPSKINIQTEKDIISCYDTIKTNITLLGINNIPINTSGNKDIKLSILTNNAIWQENNLKDIQLSSNITGEAKATLISDSDKNGFYIQKEWIKNIDVSSEIILPYDLSEFFDINNINDIYLYLILDKDPILGKKKALENEEGILEYYSNLNLRSYEINGRKSAFIKMQDIDGTLYSRFIKPTSITIEENQNINLKNLFILNNNETKFNKDINHLQIVSILNNISLISSDTSVVSSNIYKTGILPSDKLEIYTTNIEKATKLTYNDIIPLSDDVIGAFVVFNKSVKIQAIYNDDYIKLESEIKEIKIKTVESEDPIVISGSKLTGKITSLGEFGYLTISEYLKNPFGLKSCSYYCIYSDAIDKKCIHKLNEYRKYFILDESKIGCIHTPEYDSNLPVNKRCPGVKAKVLNPFILYSEIE